MGCVGLSGDSWSSWKLGERAHARWTVKKGTQQDRAASVGRKDCKAATMFQPLTALGPRPEGCLLPTAV